MKMAFFKNVFETWVTATPDGRSFVPLPWDVDGRDNVGARPFYLRPYISPAKILFGCLILISIFAFVLSSKISMAISVGVLAIFYYSLKESWLRSGAIRVSSQHLNIQVCEKSTYQLKLRIRNDSRIDSLDGYLFIDFKGSLNSKHYLKIPKLGIEEESEVKIDLVADAGMGVFELSDVLVITSDRFGLFSRCVRQEIDFELEVSPEFIAMPSFKLNVAGRATHSGMIEAKTSGDSTSFLGLRDFRVGDSIRRIDWKRTAKHFEIIVRDFEKQNSTDATIFIDDRQAGLFEFRGINSFEHLKDTSLTVCRTLIEQGIRVQIILPDGRYFPFGTGSKFLEDVADIIRDLLPVGGGTFTDFLQSNKELVPPDSLVIPIFSAVDINIEKIHEVFFGWDAIRCQVIPVVMDAPKFESHVVKEAQQFAKKKMDVTFLRQLYMGSEHSQNYENIARKIYESTIVIGPNETIGGVYSRMYPWQR